MFPGVLSLRKAPKYAKTRYWLVFTDYTLADFGGYCLAKFWWLFSAYLSVGLNVWPVKGVCMKPNPSVIFGLQCISE